MSNAEENELKAYIQNSIDENYEEIAYKNSNNGKICIYKHKDNNRKNRNDEVFRSIRGKSAPNIEKILEVCSDDDCVIVIEEFIYGKSLLEIIENEKISRKDACRYAYQLCNALEWLHGKGIIHRDLKPSNVIINEQNEAVLIDLGIARKISQRIEKDTNSLGTIGYAAPEQFGLSQSSFQTDIYSLGVLLNIMLTGEHPALSEPKGALKRIIRKCTSTQISKRYKTAAALRRELRFFI